MSTIKGIPTTYAGIEMRSRLEARWAAFVDACEWRWTYEPTDLNGWIPDFSIGERSTLVEIKPFASREEWGDVVAQIEASGCMQPVALFGITPAPEQPDSAVDAPVIGWLAEPFTTGHFEVWNLNFGFTEGNRKLGLCSLDGAWQNLIWPLVGKPARVWMGQDDTRRVLYANWAKACNSSQWRPQ